MSVSSIDSHRTADTNLIFLNNPAESATVAKAHATKHGHRDAQARVAQRAVLTLGPLDGLFQSRGKLTGIDRHLVRGSSGLTGKQKLAVKEIPMSSNSCLYEPQAKDPRSIASVQ